MYDTIIIGAGAAGLGAAIYSARLGMKTLVLTETIGGTIITAYSIENYPGFKKLSGQELADKLKEHALEYNVEIKEEKAEDIQKKQGFFIIKTKKQIYKSKTIIYAAGTIVRKLNVPGEEEFSNKGVHYCALCDGPVYQDKVLGIVGGSDSAAKEALLLTEFAKKVYIIYRKENIRAEPLNAKKVEQNKKIEIINNTNITEIKGNTIMDSVIFDRPYKGKKEFELEGLFVEIGRIPLTELGGKLGVKLNGKKEIITDKESKTNIDGFFAAGDCTDSKFKQAITAVGEAVNAAYSAYQYLQKN